MSALYFVLLLGGLIFIHELGHFLLAKASGVRVLTFSIGFGPALLKKKWGDTEYKLAAIPLGGFVRMHGDEPGQEVPPEERAVAFNYKPLWKRTLIVLAGPVFNLLLPFVVFFFLFLADGQLLPANIGAVTPGGPAWEAGIRPGDVVTRIDDRPIDYWWEMQAQINASIGQELAITVQRGEQEEVFKVVPEEAEVVQLKHVNLVDKEGRIQVTQVYVEPVVAVGPTGGAFAAGLRNWDRVLAVAGKPVTTYAELERLVTQATGPLTLTVVREEPTGLVGHALFAKLSDPMDITLALPAADLQLWSAEMVVHTVSAESPAAVVGLKSGDRIITVNGKAYPLWMIMEAELAAQVEEEHTIVWFDGQQQRSATFSLVPKTEKGEFNEDKQVVVFGAHNHSRVNIPEPIPNNARLSYALRHTWAASYDALRITIASVGGLVVGKVPIKEMGGPILIYDMASKTEKHGWTFFFNLMAWLSISLGIINLFPVPILDGGHLFFFAVEAVMRREVPLKVRQIASYFGLAIILLLMVVVFKNDIARNWDTISNWF